MKKAIRWKIAGTLQPIHLSQSKAELLALELLPYRDVKCRPAQGSTHLTTATISDETRRKPQPALIKVRDVRMRTSHLDFHSFVDSKAVLTCCLVYVLLISAFHVSDSKGCEDARFKKGAERKCR